MAGHSKWANIKHRKESTDLKRGVLFLKLLQAISVAAKQEPNPQFNPRLKNAIEKAEKNQIPQDKIKNAVKRATETANNIEELMIEAYSSEGVAILIEIITNNKNQAVLEIKKILNKNNIKIANPGSVLWVFENKNDGWQAKFKQKISDKEKTNLQNLISELEESCDVQKIYVNL